MKYNYVYMGSTADFQRISFGDIEKVSWAKYVCGRIDSSNPFLTKLYQLHTSPKTNCVFSLPGKKIWNSMMFRGSFPDNKPICFVFYPKSRWLENGIISYLRKKYPDCRIAVLFQDLVRHSSPKGFETLKNQVDMCLSFDHADVKQYGMEYYPLIYSPCEIPEDDNIPESDVYFVGKAKDRLPQILSAYEKLRDSGLKCSFYITGVESKDQKYADEIVYGGQMPYIENLKHIQKTKCLLEIMQGGGYGYTLRACEAIMYDKKMISNNPKIKEAPFYAPERISVFENVEEIDVSFVTKEPINADYQWKAELSPLKLLEYIDERI